MINTTMPSKVWDVQMAQKKNGQSTIIKKRYGGPRGRVVKVADFSALDHSTTSPMWVRASHGARIHM